MAAFLICYDLNKEGAGYSDANKKLTDRIKEIADGWWHHLDSTWIIKSEWTAAQIRDDLKGYIDDNDELLVTKSSGVGAWSGFNERGSKWLKDNL